MRTICMTRMCRAKAAIPVAFAAGALAACAGNPAQAPASFAQAQASIDQAEQADAQRYASRELTMARQKLEQARDAQQSGDEEVAARLATQAQLDADLAAAIADNRETEESVATLQETLETLRQETRRGEPAAPQPPQ